jgi:hypothetical protein
MTDLTKESIISLLERNDRAVERAILVIFRNQTFDEQQASDVKYRNGRGFNAQDAKFGSVAAKYLQREGHMEDWQIRYWRKRDIRGVMKIGKYWKQLIEAAKEKQNVA